MDWRQLRRNRQKVFDVVSSNGAKYSMCFILDVNIHLKEQILHRFSELTVKSCGVDVAENHSNTEAHRITISVRDVGLKG